jgi:hypothetical protein
MQSLIRRGRAPINGMLDRPLAAGEFAWGSCIVTWSAGAHRRRRRRAGRMATSQLPTLGRRRLTSDGRAEGSVGPPRGYERRIGSERLADFKKTVEALVASASTTRRLAGSPPASTCGAKTSRSGWRRAGRTVTTAPACVRGIAAAARPAPGGAGLD